jgi:hypothetical protein
MKTTFVFKNFRKWFKIQKFISHYSYALHNLNSINRKTRLTAFTTTHSRIFIKNKLKLTNYIFKSFSLFYKTNLAVQKLTLKPHDSFKHFFVRIAKNGSAFTLSVDKFFKKYKNVYNLMYNMFYYNVKTLVFSNSFLKNEVISFNWLTLSRINYKFRLKHLLIFFTPIKNLPYMNKLIRFITKTNHITAFIVDSVNHHKIVSLLRRQSVLTIGPVVVVYDSKNIDIVLPTLTNNIFTQLVLVKTLFGVKKTTEHLKYVHLKNTWVSFLSK